jgi:hypothetical protein
MRRIVQLEKYVVSRAFVEVYIAKLDSGRNPFRIWISCWSNACILRI